KTKLNCTNQPLSSCLNKLCSKFEVDMKKIEVPVRFYLGCYTTNSHRVPSKLHLIFNAFFCHKYVYISLSILLLSQNNHHIWNPETQTFPMILSMSYRGLVCDGRSGALWLPSHHPGGCCTLVVDEEIPPDNVKRFECLEKCYINVMN
uniref:Uncharacterized protein n=1 Tax=Sinocyclocheilus grahami TaxID=75366 RepID=A0A672NBF6_SINGR